MATEAADIGRRERKKLQTRTSLEEAAWKLFLEKGFDETTVDDITEAVDVSQRTFFRHFPSKEAVLFSDVEEQLESFRNNLCSRPADEPIVTSVRKAVLALATDWESRRTQHLLRSKLVERAPTVAAYGRQHVYMGWHNTIRDEVARRLDVDPIQDLRPNVYAGAAISALEAAIQSWQAADGDLKLLPLVQEALDVLEAGFGN